MNRTGKALLGLSALVPFASCDKVEDQRPNIIFFIVDDMGWMDISRHRKVLKYPSSPYHPQ